MGFRIDGLDDLQRSLRDLGRRAKELDGQHEVPFSELFPASFMQKHSAFESFDELLEAGGFVVNSPEDFEAIPDDEFDRHIARVTDFDDWESMMEQASADYVERQLFG